jgi:Na+-transporting methylmalonyl-CoA/oxaloacetate decarboxylase gamma subunit
MGTSFLLLLMLIFSIFLSRYVSNKINPPDVLPSEDQKDESLRKAKAAAVAVAYLTVNRYESEVDSEI